MPSSTYKIDLNYFRTQRVRSLWWLMGGVVLATILGLDTSSENLAASIFIGISVGFLMVGIDWYRLHRVNVAAKSHQLHIKGGSLVFEDAGRTTQIELKSLKRIVIHMAIRKPKRVILIDGAGARIDLPRYEMLDCLVQDIESQAGGTSIERKYILHT